MTGQWTSYPDFDIKNVNKYAVSIDNENAWFGTRKGLRQLDL